MVQGRNRVISYKVHKQINVPEEEWFVVPNTHEAIIDRGNISRKRKPYISATQGQPPANRKSISMSGFLSVARIAKIAMRRKTARDIALLLLP